MSAGDAGPPQGSPDHQICTVAEAQQHISQNVHTYKRICNNIASLERTRFVTATLAGNLFGRARLRACLAACLAVRFVVATDGNDEGRKMTII